MADINGYSKEQPIYEQLPNEPDKWYIRFQKFLALGPRRSVLKTYGLERQENAKHKQADTSNIAPIAVPPDWRKYTKEYQWAERAAAYDKEQSLSYIERYEDGRRNVLEKFRSDAEQQSKLAAEIGQKALEVCQKVLEAALDNDNWKKLSLAELPNFLRAAGDIVEKATAVRATMLNVERLIKEVDDRKAARG